MCLGTLNGPDQTYVFSFENEYFSDEFSSIARTKTTENDDGNGSFRKWFQKQSLLNYLFIVLNTPRFLSRKVTTEAFENGAEKRVIYSSFLQHFRVFPRRR